MMTVWTRCGVDEAANKDFNQQCGQVISSHQALKNLGFNLRLVRDVLTPKQFDSLVAGKLDVKEFLRRMQVAEEQKSFKPSANRTEESLPNLASVSRDQL
jgi:hypothetical protein